MCVMEMVSVRCLIIVNVMTCILDQSVNIRIVLEFLPITRWYVRQTVRVLRLIIVNVRILFMEVTAQCGIVMV